jgi:cysteinyl-tRNA synthetase
MLRVLNSQSRQKEDFLPLDKDGRDVRMYVCGPTVYDSLHLGHARAAITPDIVRRYLEYKGFRVRFIMNFTDVDDKIIKRAAAENCDWKQLTEKYIAEFHALMKALNVLPATAYPRATEHIPEMLEIVQVLLEKKHAYVAKDGDVYFDTTSYPRYGNLSGRNLEEDDAGLSQRISEERMQVKKHPGDFVLWKLAKPGEPFWESPWGQGRPGWHLECSAMSRKHLGVPFDIHGGGQDLLFPHHEDEKAQTECAFCEELHGSEAVRYWIHNGFLTIQNEKMSKSLGNVKWLREMVWPGGPYDPMTVRMIFLSAHYRAPINFEPGLFDEAKARLERIYNALDAIDREIGVTGAPSKKGAQSEPTEAIRAFEEAMDDDFNTAGALAAVFDLVSEVNKQVASKLPDRNLLDQARRDIGAILQTLGVRETRASKPSATESGDSLKLVELLLQVRQKVRAAKLFAVSDEIRNGLKELGYEVEDLPGGKWAIKKK